MKWLKSFWREWHNYILNGPIALIWFYDGFLNPETKGRFFQVFNGMVFGVYIGLGIYGIGRRMQKREDAGREALDRKFWEINKEIEIQAKYAPKSTPGKPSGPSLREY